MKRVIQLIYHARLPHEYSSRELMEDELFREYVRDNGWHFTDSLADHASMRLTNEDGTNHCWTTKQVKEAFEKNGLTKNPMATWGDIAYAANMHYSDEYPKFLKTEAEVLDYTARHSMDVDGYEGMQFMRWIADYIGRGLRMDWDMFT